MDIDQKSISGMTPFDVIKTRMIAMPGGFPDHDYDADDWRTYKSAAVAYNAERTREDGPDPARLARLRRAAVEAYKRKQGDAYSKAILIGEGECGIATPGTLIGTDNVQDCVVLALRDPSSGACLLAHVAGYNQTYSANDLRNLMPLPADGRRLEARLIGARPTGWGVLNLQRVFSAMRLTDSIRLLSADIADGRFPSAFVLDTGSFSLRRAVPTATRQDKLVANSRGMLGENNRPLDLVFDNRDDLGFRPWLVTRRNINHIRSNFSKPDEAGLADFLIEKAGIPQDALPLTIDSIVQMQKAIGRSGRPLKQAFEARLHDMGVDPNSDHRSVIHAKHLVATMPRYLGTGSEPANLSVLDFVQSGDWIKPAEEGVEVDRQKVTSFTPTQPATPDTAAASRLSQRYDVSAF
ncbi:MAG: hypothetical protein Alpg2KO_18720 [Alphaproteobacteria bacterium]